MQRSCCALLSRLVRAQRQTLGSVAKEADWPGKMRRKVSDLHLQVGDEINRNNSQRFHLIVCTRSLWWADFLRRPSRMMILI